MSNDSDCATLRYYEAYISILTAMTEWLIHVHDAVLNAIRAGKAELPYNTENAQLFRAFNKLCSASERTQTNNVDCNEPLDKMFN